MKRADAERERPESTVPDSRRHVGKSMSGRVTAATASVVLERSHAYAGAFVLICLIDGAVLMAASLTPALAWLRVPSAIATLPLYGWLVTLAIKFSRQGTDTVPRELFAFGVAFIMAGTALDVGAYLMTTPLLAADANVFEEAIATAGLPVFYRAGRIVFHVLIVQLILLLWAAFFRHRNTLIALARQAEPKTFPQFVIAAMGSARLKWWGLIINLKPDPYGNYCQFMTLAFFALPASVYRYYLGLRWLGLVPYAPVVIFVLISGVPTITYVAWLWVEWGRGGTMDV